jgi:hypothetical protein
MGEADLFELASKQGISRCVIGGGACGLYFRYEGFRFLRLGNTGAKLPGAAVENPGELS